jgi:hypothetical protein
MRIHWVANLLITIACCLVGKVAVAQRTAVEPLAPVVARPVLPTSNLGVPVQTGSTGAQRQPATPTTPTQSVQRAWPQPVWLLNSRFIVSDISNIGPLDIAKLDIYKEPNRLTPMKWRSLTEHGIVSITLKPGVKLHFKTKSLAAIRRQLRLSGLVSFKLNGMRLEDESLRIAKDAIAGLDVSPSDIETIVNIRLVPPKPAPLLPPGPPGSIRIRGVAGM